MSTASEDLALAILRQAASDPAGAARQLRDMALKLTAAADRLDLLSREGETVIPAGMGDRVQIRVLGPDGTVTREIDTGKET